MSALISIGSDTEGGYWYSVTDGGGEWFAGGSSGDFEYMIEVEVSKAVKDLEAAGWSAAIPEAEAPLLDSEQAAELVALSIPTTHPDGKPLSAMERWALSKAPLEPVANIAGVQIDAGVTTSPI